MRLIVIHSNDNSVAPTDNAQLRFGISNEPIASVIFDGLSNNLRLKGDKNVMLAIPERWGAKSCVTSPKVGHYNRHIQLSYEDIQRTKRNSWFVVSNGQFATQVNSDLLHKVLANVEADVVMLSVEPELLEYREKVRLTAQSKVAGFRRLYSDAIEPAAFPLDWPHHIFVRNGVLNHILPDGKLPQSFCLFVKRCRLNSLTLRAFRLGGTVFDLCTEEGLLGLIAARLNASRKDHFVNTRAQKEILIKGEVSIAPSARLFGNVLFGKNVSIGHNAIIVGPTIIGNDVKIVQGAVVSASIIGSGVSVPRNHLVQNRVLINTQGHRKQARRIQKGDVKTNVGAIATYQKSRLNNFRAWPTFSYAGSLKRVADIVAAVTVLILFAPLLPMIALAIKLTSRGPVFFKDRRQGRYGKEFCCLKFRTMTVGADKIQHNLRVLNQADGPQFKMPEDPRVTGIGRFLRDTYIDEVPQFLSVLIGQMSVVGPRPSPEAENTTCPRWRDARLSVRPGITGLWQVCGTRRPMRDFQEWIHYDIKYVRELSLRMDLWICWQTAKKIAKNFISQF